MVTIPVLALALSYLATAIMGYIIAVWVGFDMWHD